MRQLTVGPNGPVFDLPWIVGQERGFFADEGVDIRILARDRAQEGKLRLSERPKESLFDEGKVQIFNACEWGCLRRVEQARRRGWLIAQRPLLLTMCLTVRPDIGVEWPQDLAGRSIGVAWETGGHYMALKMLEGFLAKPAINCVHAGQHVERLEAVVAGRVDAAILPEPYVTAATKQGCRVVAEAVFRGGEIVDDELDVETVRGLMRALRRAVVELNADRPAYRRRLLEMELARGVTYEEVRWDRVSYVDPRPYTREQFDQAAEWMRRWNMIGDDVAYEEIVKPELAAAVTG
jgi:NitT/TauT family transport system substrate-binding protein